MMFVDLLQTPSPDQLIHYVPLEMSYAWHYFLQPIIPFQDAFNL
jgi:hypothetical protein